MEGQQASLSRFPSITRKLFLAGYILRIIPVVNIVGTVVTAIAWYKASEWRKHTNYIIAMIGSLTVLVSLLLGIYYGLNTALAYQGMRITSDMTLEQLKSELLKSIDAMQASLTSINALVVPVIAGIGLLLEAPGFYRISRDTENNIPSYITYLAVFIAVIYIVSGPISYVSASRLESLREFIVSAKTKEDLLLGYTSRLMTAMVPSMAIGILEFILVLVTYILIAYKFYKLSEAVLAQKIVEETGVEELI